LQGQKNTANQKALTADAQQATANSNKMMASGEALQQYLASGTLPAGYQSQVDQADRSCQDNGDFQRCSAGPEHRPTQNTALAAALAKIDASKPAMQSQCVAAVFVWIQPCQRRSRCRGTVRPALPGTGAERHGGCSEHRQGDCHAGVGYERT